MKKITSKQITKIHVLLNQFGLLDHKKEMVLSLTNGRTDSTRELTSGEAIDLIKYLVEQDPRTKHIKAIKHLAYQAGIIYGNTPDDYRMNDAKLNAFLKSKGVVKKELHVMSLEELKQVHRQFEGIARNNQKTRDNKNARTKTDALLNELNINTL